MGDGSWPGAWASCSPSPGLRNRPPCPRSLHPRSLNPTSAGYRMALVPPLSTFSTASHNVSLSQRGITSLGTVPTERRHWMVRAWANCRGVPCRLRVSRCWQVHADQEALQGRPWRVGHSAGRAETTCSAALAQPRQHVLGDPFDLRVTPSQPVSPVGRPRSDDGPASVVRVRTEHGMAVTDALHRFGLPRAEHA